MNKQLTVFNRVKIHAYNASKVIVYLKTLVYKIVWAFKIAYNVIKTIQTCADCANQTMN